MARSRASRSSLSRHDSKTEPPSATKPAPAAVVTPPYWQQHSRHSSRASVLSHGRPTPITLEDNSGEPEGVTSPLWAKLVAIDSHAVVSGNVRGVGDYVVWICRVDTLDVRMRSA